MSHSRERWTVLGGQLLAARSAAAISFVLVLASMAVDGRCAAPLQAEAIVGRPFGVARIVVSVPAEDAAMGQAGLGLRIDERDGRALYPAFAEGLLRRILASADNGPPGTLAVFFLFRGDGPLEVTVCTPAPQTVRVVPRADAPRAYQRLLNRWWRNFQAAARADEEIGDYPPIVQTYLTSMLARRLRLDPAPRARRNELALDAPQRTLQLLAGVERLRLATLQATSSGQGVAREPATLPPPDSPPWPELVIPDSAAAGEIEPIANHVPQNCFYVRFGAYSNYVWLSGLVDEYGGDLSRMIRLRGHDPDLHGRVQRQLALEQSLIGDLLGDTVISDVALVGRDLYQQEGAAVGMLFEARNALLQRDIDNQRRRALDQMQTHGARLETVSIRGHNVSLLSTPDNQLRSFYAIDGNYHLVTTSRAMVEGFFEAGAGRESLGRNAEFRFARARLPLQRNDTVFAYFSSAFFQGLVGPQYQIELNRRLRAATDIELVKLARLAARAEGVRADTLDELMQAGVLPPGFAQRSDGSGPIITDTEVLDSARGAVGSFIPIPDLPLRRVSAEERARYESLAAYYVANWRQFDPLLAAMKRVPGKDAGRERLLIEAQLAPFFESKYGWLASLLGPPVEHAVVPPPGSIVSAQAHLRGGILFPSIPPHTLFVGVQDVVPPGDLAGGGILQTLRLLQTTPGYLGAWPKPGFLDLLPFNLAGNVDPAGFSALPLGLWRWQGAGFSVLSFQRPVLDAAVGRWRVEPTDNAAQIRVQVGDVSSSHLAASLNQLMYDRARQASLGNARLMHTLTQQLQVPAAEAKDVAESLIDARLVCTLGGEYHLADEHAAQIWKSTAWPVDGQPLPPADYQAPLLTWFRGTQFSLIKYPDALVVHAELDLQRKPLELKLKLPFLDQN